MREAIQEPLDLHTSREIIVKKLVTEHPEACKLLAQAFALTDLEKRQYEECACEYHDDDAGPPEIAPFNMEAIAEQMSRTCDDAYLVDSVDFERHHAYRVTYAFLSSLSCAGLDQLAPATDEELLTIANKASLSATKEAVSISTGDKELRQVAQAMLDVCKHSASKGRSLDNINIDAVLTSCKYQDSEPADDDDDAGFAPR